MLRRHKGIWSVSLMTAILAGAAGQLAGCAEDAAPPMGQELANPFASGADFVAIPRTLDADALAARARRLPPTHGNQDFYLAVKKSELARRWFLSGFIEQSYPGGYVDGLADVALPTRVVTFRVQKDKLFVFDAAEGNAFSDVFDPEVLIESYPIVHGEEAHADLPGADQYVVFDPAAGLNRFGVVSDLIGSQKQKEPGRFQIDLSYLQSFRALSDGVQYQLVFTGYGEQPFRHGDEQSQELNAFQSSGTMTIALRRYSAPADFHALVDDGELGRHYFADYIHHVPDTGSDDKRVLHWNIHPGMHPIRWQISHELVDYAARHPELFEGIDLVSAVQRGVESWNAAFGFTVLEARLAPSGTSFADDDKNVIVFDPDPRPQFAFAQWHANPDNGEVRGASVYLPFAFVDPSFFSDDPPAPGAAAPRLPVAIAPAGLSPALLCLREASDLRAQVASKRGLTAKRKLELFVQATIAHEIGHTLGLRHNFKGSLSTPSTTIMDYLIDDDGIALHQAGRYDIDALRFLYGLSPTPAAQDFCTDEDLKIDPRCAQKDHGADPIDFWARRYGNALGGVFDDPAAAPVARFDRFSFGLLAYVRAGTGGDALRAWDVAMADLRTPTPADAPAADRAVGFLFDLLYGSAKSEGFIKATPSDPAVLAAIIADLRASLLDPAQARSFATRRQAVDVLKKMQSVAAYRTLLEVERTLDAQLVAGGMDGDEQAFLTDLLARVERAVSPYFD